MRYEYNKNLRYEYICAMLAAHRLRQAGVTVEVIAREAGKHPSTIRRWLRNFEATRV